MNNKDLPLKKKILHIKWIVEEFLEEDLRYEKLKKRPEFLDKLRIGLKENLLNEEHYKDIDYKPIAYVYRQFVLLNQFWSQFKTALSQYRKYGDKTNITNPFSNKSTKLTNSPAHLIIRSKIVNDPSESIFDKLKFTNWGREIEDGILLEAGFNTGKVVIHKDRLDILRIFITQLEGLPTDIILECGDENCNRWFIKTHKKKKYCNNNCASRAYQTNLRHNPEKEPQYENIKRKQKKHYRKKVLGK